MKPGIYLAIYFSMARSIDSRRRARNGQLIKECQFCTCPDGCACEGQPHGCGPMKTYSYTCPDCLITFRSKDGQILMVPGGGAVAYALVQFDVLEKTCGE